MMPLDHLHRGYAKEGSQGHAAALSESDLRNIKTATFYPSQKRMQPKSSRVSADKFAVSRSLSVYTFSTPTLYILEQFRTFLRHPSPTNEIWGQLWGQHF